MKESIMRVVMEGLRRYDKEKKGVDFASKNQPSKLKRFHRKDDIEKITFQQLRKWRMK